MNAFHGCDAGAANSRYCAATNEPYDPHTNLYRESDIFIILSLTIDHNIQAMNVAVPQYSEERSGRAGGGDIPAPRHLCKKSFNFA